jgi:hypothetical protein
VPIFEQSIVSAVLHHMNTDHPEDNVLIVHAFGPSDATDVTMTTLDHLGGTWTFSSQGATGELTVPWSTEISERAEIRREIVVLYDKACEVLEVTPRPH